MKWTILGLFLLLGCLFATPATAQDQLGTIKSSAAKCPTGQIKGTACYQLDITCPGLPDYTAYAKFIQPAQPVGTIIFTVGGDVVDIYEGAYPNGKVTVQNVVNKNFTAVELTYGEPFYDGPGWEWNANGAGVRVAACRYATAVKWIHDHTANVALCATGSSAGGELISQGLSHYGIGDYLSFAEITSGPPFGNVEHACVNDLKPALEYCSNVTIGEGVGMNNALKYVDPAYPGPWCSSSLQSHSTQYEQQFINDSVESPDAILSYPNTRIRFLFGGLDTSSAIRQGMTYQAAITTPTTKGCVKDAPHSIPIALDGAQTIASDLIKNCHK